MTPPLCFRFLLYARPSSACVSTCVCFIGYFSLQRQSLSGEVKALTAQLTATQSSRDQAQQQVNQLRRSAKSEAKAYTDVQAQVSNQRGNVPRT